MKKNLYFFVSLVFALLAVPATMGAQVLKQLLKEGKSWNYVYDYHGIDDNGNLFHETIPYQEWIEGDTIIDGKTYFKMHSTAIKYPISSLKFWREDTGKVYAYDEDLEQEMLMYDFSLNKDEMADILGNNNIKVNKVDTISVCGIERRRIFLNFGLWVEGVGSPALLSEPLGHLFTDGCISQMVSCYENGECVFTSQDFNTASGINDFRATSGLTNAKSSEYYDLQGRRLAAPPAKGVYIQDGRKVLK